MQKKTFKEEIVTEVKKIIKKNPGYDFRHAVTDSKNILKDLKWKSKTISEDDMLLMLRAYQRVIRIMPPQAENLASRILEKGIHSAVQIAEMPESRFIEICLEIFDNNREVVEQIYKNAIVKRSQLIVQHMNIRQNSEPHAKAARI